MLNKLNEKKLINEKQNTRLSLHKNLTNDKIIGGKRSTSVSNNVNISPIINSKDNKYINLNNSIKNTSKYTVITIFIFSFIQAEEIIKDQ